LPQNSGATLIAELRARAESLGFDAFGVARADARPDLPEKLATAIERGWHGDMEWIPETAERRGSPTRLWDRARSVVMLGVNYGPDSDPMAMLEQRTSGNISVYARNRDYHGLIKGKLKELAGLLSRRAEAQVKVFVDTAPLMEKPLAEAAGIGWQGKHTVLVSREFGSWLFLGAILTDADLPMDKPHEESCGSCTRCLDICPTNAFPAPFQLDARRCLAYLNIEHKGPIPREYRVAMGNRIYGCDDCLAVCPWNKFASATREAKLVARDDLKSPALADLARLDDAAFRALFAGSPVKRLGYPRFLRNVLIALGNSGAPELAPLAEARLTDPKPLIRGAAIWATRRLVAPERAAALALAFLGSEEDMEVRTEWQAEVQPAAAA
jgi:epoxyqueuosine reductase